MIEVKGKAGIVARVIADSISPQGIRLTTWEAEYPRLIHSELMTHRMFSRNAASSRAIPFNKMVEQLIGRPVRFGANQSGMQDKGYDHEALLIYETEYDDEYSVSAEYAWEIAKADAVRHAKAYSEAGFHKQVSGRITEPFQMMKTIITATEVANFWWLRDDEAADPSIAELARCMKGAYDQSEPELLQPGEFHLPYIDTQRDAGQNRLYFIGSGNTEDYDVISLEEAIKVSCARCAAVSYRNEGYGLDKSVDIFGKLLGSDKKHASAFEHVATPMQEVKGNLFVDDVDQWVNHSNSSLTWEPGISHADREGNLWSGNFKGWVQYRKTIDGENYVGQT